MCVLQTKSLRASATVSRSATGALLVAGGVCAPAPLGKTEAAAATAIKMDRRSLHGRPTMRLLPAVIINALHERANPLGRTASTTHGCSPDAKRKRQSDRDHRGRAARQYRGGALADIEKLDRQHAQAERHVGRERRHQRAFARLDPRHAGDGEEAVERGGAVERGREREERQAMQQRRHEPGLPVRRAHHAYTAMTARKPSTRSTMAKTASTASSATPRQGVHSRTILRSPIGAWIATATTNTA